MATGDLAALDNASDINSLIAMLNTIRPAGGYTQTQTTGPQTTETTDKTQTTEEVASPEAVQQLIQQMLQGNSGMAAIASGEKTAGLYNSSTNQQLQNDLLSRVASAAAALNKKTVQTVSGGKVTTSGNTVSSEKVMTPQISGGDLAKAAAAAAAASALKNAINNMQKSGGQSGSAGAQNAKKNDQSAEASKKKADAEAAKLLQEWKDNPDTDPGNAWKTASLADRNAVDAFMGQGENGLGFAGSPRNSFNSPVTAALNASGAVNDPTVESIVGGGSFLRTDENGNMIFQNTKQNPFSNLQNTDTLNSDQIAQMMQDPNAQVPSIGGDGFFSDNATAPADYQGQDPAYSNAGYDAAPPLPAASTSWWQDAGLDPARSDHWDHFDSAADYNLFTAMNSGHINGAENFGWGGGNVFDWGGGGGSVGWDD